MGASGISRSPRIFAERREYSRSGTDSSRGGCRCLGSVIRQADVFDPSQKRRKQQKQKNIYNPTRDSIAASISNKMSVLKNELEARQGE